MQIVAKHLRLIHVRFWHEFCKLSLRRQQSYIIGGKSIATPNEAGLEQMAGLYCVKESLNISTERGEVKTAHGI